MAPATCVPARCWRSARAGNEAYEQPPYCTKQVPDPLNPGFTTPFIRFGAIYGSISAGPLANTDQLLSANQQGMQVSPAGLANVSQFTVSCFEQYLMNQMPEITFASPTVTAAYPQGWWTDENTGDGSWFNTNCNDYPQHSEVSGTGLAVPIDYNGWYVGNSHYDETFYWDSNGDSMTVQNLFLSF